MQKWEQMFPDHMIIIRQLVNRRQGAARNLGLSYASADWIAFVDADDWLEPDYLERLYQPAEQFGFDVVCCDAVRDTSKFLTRFDEKTRRKAYNADSCVVIDTEEKRRELIAGRSMGDIVVGKLIRKDLLTDCRMFFPEDLVYEDMYWMPLLHVYARSIYVRKETLYHYYVNEHSTVNFKNSDHHMDFLTIQLMKWNDYRERGLLNRYQKELEADGLRDALLSLELFATRYDQPPFSLYQLEKEIIRQNIPDYRGNPYLKNIVPEALEFFLDALYEPMDKTGFQSFIKKARRSFQ